MIDFAQARIEMVDTQLKGRGIADERVLDVMGRLQRECFVDPEFAEQAYADNPLPIGFGQTISGSTKHSRGGRFAPSARDG